MNVKVRAAVAQQIADMITAEFPALRATARENVVGLGREGFLRVDADGISWDGATWVSPNKGVGKRAREVFAAFGGGK